MNWGARLILLTIIALGCPGREARAQWWVGGDSYSLRVDKYDSFYGEARPIRWSVERPPGVHWKHMLAPKRVIHARQYHASGGYPAMYHAAYPSPYHAGLPMGDAQYYLLGHPVGYPVDMIARHSHFVTWRPPAVQVDPLPSDGDKSVPYPAEGIAPEVEGVPSPEADGPPRGLDTPPEPSDFGS